MTSVMLSKINFWKRKMNLKKIFEIQETLQEAGYFDISRIANEIYTYSLEKNIPLDSILKRISEQEPWEYIKGFAEFRGKNFRVTSDTLIPRIESEQLVDISLDLIEKNDLEKVIDIGTGTGCLIISIAEECKDNNIEFVGIDISKEALDVAVSNDGNKKVEFMQQDLVRVEDLKENLLLVANLPYIPSRMYENLEKSVKDFEPKIALEAGNDGLFFYKKLLDILQEIKKNTFLLIEIEPSTLPDLMDYTKDIKKEIIKDFREKKRFALFNFS